ncbi:MazG-like family protein [Alicyclobacillus dauci]|uniref:MazG-like family protein n=1 Tax=Alicyclobacillus dauci TaxID=1475485 RepID=A0ABY6Z261_9BACL|nr:MazG-like family protein [Alicyclobacillus dauci]WAH36987.1 MazG-like family protein [Alicyclobacillus dauci]
MADVESHIDLTRKLQTVEHDRIELVQQAVEVLRSIQSGNEGELTEALSGVVGLAYLLGVQMGVPPHRIDHGIVNSFRIAAEVDDKRHTDLTEVIRYLSDRY